VLNFSRCLIALVTQTAVTDSKPCGVHNYSLQTNQPGPVPADILLHTSQLSLAIPLTYGWLYLKRLSRMSALTTGTHLTATER